MLFILCPESYMWLIGQLEHQWRRREEREGMNNPFKQGQASLFWKPQGLGLSVLGAQVSSALTLSLGTFPCILGKSQNLLILPELTALEMQLCWNSGVQHQQKETLKGKTEPFPGFFQSWQHMLPTLPAARSWGTKSHRTCHYYYTTRAWK